MKRLVLVTLLALGACVSTSQMQLSPSTWRISSAGNAYTSYEAVNGAVLKRAAEITISQGKRYFVILNSEDQSATGTMVVPGQATTFSNVNAYGNGNYANAYGTSTTTYRPAQAYNFVKPGQASVIMLREQGCESCYDAEIIMAQYTKKKPASAAPASEPTGGRSQKGL